MSALIMIMVLTLVTVIIVEVGNRVRLPWPALMVLVGLAIAWVPGSHLGLPSNLVLPLLLPPLLYTAAERTSWQMFRRKWRSIVYFAMGLTLVTAFVVTGVSWLIYPGIGLPAALILGAAVAPPDPVAVEAVSRTMPFPRRILAVLQTEGLFNDAVALVLFEVALAALTTGHDISPRELLGDFLVGMVLATVVAFGLASVIRWIVRESESAAASAAATIVLPYAAYLAADAMNASGVLAVVIATLEYRRTESPDDVEERLVRSSFWEVAELILTGLAFGLIGEGFQNVLHDYGRAVWPMVWQGTFVAVTLLVTRAGYLFALMTWNKRKRALAAPKSAREVLIMTWGGMRGLLTLALVVSLPATIGLHDDYFPWRAKIIVASCMVLVVTLLFAGLTLPFVMRRVGLDSEGDQEHRQELELVKLAGHRAHLAVTQMPELPEAVIERIDSIVEQMESGLLDRSVQQTLDADLAARHAHRALLYDVHIVALGAAREAIIEARNSSPIDPFIVDRVLSRVDRQSSLYRRH